MQLDGMNGTKGKIGKKKDKKASKLKRSSNTHRRDSKQIEKFLKNATVQDFQRYYQKIPSRVDSKPVNFEIDTYFRQEKLLADMERMKELRTQNFALVFKINRIQRSRGKVDHINTSHRVISKHHAIIKKIEEIETNNFALYDRLQHVRGFLPTRAALEADWKNNIELMKEKAKFPLVLPGTVDLEKVDDQYLDNLPKVFLEFGVPHGNIFGRIVIALFNDKVPVTVANFIALCKNFRQNLEENRTSDGIYPHYAGSPIHRIFPQLYFEGGDIVRGQGGTGRAANGVDFYPESFDIPHDYGTISMSLTLDGRVNSLFAINFKRLNVLNGRRPAFGQVIKGFKVLKMIEDCGSKNGRPKHKIIIANCGLIH